MSVIHIYTHDKSRVRKTEDFHISVFSLRHDSNNSGIPILSFFLLLKVGSKDQEHQTSPPVAVKNEHSGHPLDLLHQNLHFNQISKVIHMHFEIWESLCL